MEAIYGFPMRGKIEPDGLPEPTVESEPFESILGHFDIPSSVFPGPQNQGVMGKTAVTTETEDIALILAIIEAIG
jgi:hypothetical protein